MKRGSDSNPFASNNPFASAPSGESEPEEEFGRGGGDDRFTVLVQRYRDMKEKNALLKRAYRDKQSEMEAQAEKFRQQEEAMRKEGGDVERLRFAYEKLLKQCKSLQAQVKEEREKAGQSSSWFGGGGQAAKDLERCKEALKAARGELRRKIQELEQMHVRCDEMEKEHKQGMMMMQNKVHAMGVEERERREEREREKQEEERWRREKQAEVEEEREKRGREEREKRETQRRLEEAIKGLRQAREEAREAEQRVERLMKEKVGWDDSSDPKVDMMNAVSVITTTTSTTSTTSSIPSSLSMATSATNMMLSSAMDENGGSNQDEMEGVRWYDACRGVMRAMQEKCRQMEQQWTQYGGGGAEDPLASKALRALLGWAGREQVMVIHVVEEEDHQDESWGKRVRRLAAAADRVALAMVGLRVRPQVRECGVEGAFREAARVARALAGALDCWEERHKWDASSVGRMGKIVENRVEQMREALKDMRDAVMRLHEKDGTGKGSRLEKKLEQCVQGAGAAVAVVRTRRQKWDQTVALVKGVRREGVMATEVPYEMQRKEAIRYMKALVPRGWKHESVKWEEAVMLKKKLPELEKDRDQLQKRCDELDERVKRLQEEGDRLAAHNAELQDVVRAQRAHVQRLLEEGRDGSSSSSSATSSSNDVISLREGEWAVRRVEQAGEGMEKEREEWGRRERAREKAQVEKSDALASEWHKRAMELAEASREDGEERRKLREELDQMRDQWKSHQEEKEMLHKGYQEQMVLLNEHLIKQGEMVGQKDAELTHMMAHRIKCAVCHNWNTVGWLVANGNGKSCKYGNHPSGFNYAPK